MTGICKRTTCIGSVALALRYEGEQWTATSNVPWLRLAAGNEQGTRSTNLVYTTDSNPLDGSRAGTITIAAQDYTRNFTVIQAGRETHLVEGNQVTRNRISGRSGVDRLRGSAVDSQRNIYVADAANDVIKKIVPGSNADQPMIVVSGLNAPEDVAVDEDGDIYIADTGNSRLRKLDVASNQLFTLVDNTQVTAVAVDHLRRVFYAEGNKVSMWDPVKNSSGVVLFDFEPFRDSSGRQIANDVVGLAVDTTGDIYVAVVKTYFVGRGNANVDWGVIRKISGDDLQVTTLFGTGRRIPTDVSVDGRGHVYVAIEKEEAIYWNPVFQSIRTLASPLGIRDAQRMVTDQMGNVYYSTAQGELWEASYHCVNASPIELGNEAGGGMLPAVLPIPRDPMAYPPVSDQPWLTITDFRDGVVHYAYTETSEDRTATITLLGETIPVAQNAADYTLDQTEYQVGWQANSAVSSAYIRTAEPQLDWNAVSNDPWLHLTAGPADSGTGEGRIWFGVDENNGPPRTGTLTIAGLTVTVRQGSRTNLRVGSQGWRHEGKGRISFAVSPEGSAWTASASDSWLRMDLANRSGTGSGSIEFEFDLNVGVQRTGAITVAGQVFTVIQDAASFVVSPQYLDYFTPDRHTNSVQVTATPDNGHWSASSNDPWLHIIPGNESGTRSATVAFTVDPNVEPGFGRTGTLTVAGHTVHVGQFPATFTLGSNHTVVGKEKTALQVSLIVSPASAPWVGASNADWLQLAPGSEGGIGSASVTINVAANLGPLRGGTVTIAGQTFAITQAGATAFRLGNTNLVIGPEAQNNRVVLFSANSADAWTASANVPWLHVSSNGVGGGLVSFVAEANTGSTRRGSLAIAGQALEVVQAGASYLRPGSERVGIPRFNFEEEQFVNEPFDNPVTAMVPIAAGHLGYGSVAADQAGNIYLADHVDNALKKWSPSTGETVTLVSTPLETYSGVAVDGTGNVYFSVPSAGKVMKWTVADSSLTTLVTNIQPNGIAVDLGGNVYIADPGANTIYRWNVGSATVAPLVSSGLSGPQAVAVDFSGNVYIADTQNNAVKRWSPLSGVSTLVSFGVGFPEALAVDKFGDVYIVSVGGGGLTVWSGGSTERHWYAESGDSMAVTTDGLGNIYFVNDFTLYQQPHAFLNPATISLAASGGSGVLAQIRPASENLLARFVPQSSEGWLTITNTANRTVEFSYGATTTNRSANIVLMGRTNRITQMAPPTVFFVDTLSDEGAGSGSLRDTVANATPGSIIRFSAIATGGTILLTNGPIQIDRDLTIDASHLDRSVTLNGNAGGRVIEVTGTASVTPDSLTITNGVHNGALGGGIFNEANLVVRNCALLGNSASGGGGIASLGSAARLAMENCTLAHNNAVFGAGLLNRQGALSLVHCTISANTASGGTGGIVIEDGTVFLANTIIAGNQGPETDLGGTATTVLSVLEHNVIGQHGGGYVAAFPAGQPNAFGSFVGDTTNAFDALLGPLGDYGGRTYTMPLLKGSAAIDYGAGMTVTADQRGFPRPLGSGPDVGAYETGTATLLDVWIRENLPASATLAELNADGDFDNDGLSNRDEWIARTNPDDVSSRVQILSIDLAQAVNGLTIATVAGRHYRAEYSTDLRNWSSASDSFAGSGNAITLPTAFPANSQIIYFRVRVSPDPIAD